MELNCKSLIILYFLLPFLLLPFARAISDQKKKLQFPSFTTQTSHHWQPTLGTLPHQYLASLSNKYGPLMLLKLGQTPTLGFLTKSG